MFHQLSLFEQPANSYQCLNSAIDLELINDSYISIERNTALKIHSIGFQPAKTIPEIPEWFIKKYTKPNDIILEPFAGSGTTIIEALKLNRKVLWLDHHPLSQLICHVKTHRVELLKVLAESHNIINQAIKQAVPSTTIDFNNKDFWFQAEVQEALERLRNQILKTNQEYQAILWLALSIAVRKCSNMNEGMILAARRINIKDIPHRTFADVFDCFRNALDKIIAALAQWYQIEWNHSNVESMPSMDARAITGN